MCCEQESFWNKEILDNAIIPIIVASITYFLFNRLDEFKKRKTQSILGALVMESLIEEVEIGNKMILEVLDTTTKSQPKHLPRKSWSGISTVSDEILLRIITISKNIKPMGFEPREIRIHTKNYFEHMIPNWDGIINSANPKEDAIKKYKTYGEASSKVLAMLYQAKELLEDNSKKWFPK